MSQQSDLIVTTRGHSLHVRIGVVVGIAVGIVVGVVVGIAVGIVVSVGTAVSVGDSAAGGIWPWTGPLAM